MYIPLHAHTSKGSVGDSILNIDDYVSKAKQYGLNSIAVTDHGSLSAIYSFYDKCIKAGIKPIIGCEVYFCDDNKDKSTTERYHLILLAKNNEGLSNLISICNNASIDGYYYRPRTDLSVLKKYGKGIIALSACVYGKVPQLLYKGLTYQADKLALQYKEIFDEFYLEIQPGNFTEQHEINSHLIEMSKRLNIGMVVTNDIHYLTEEDAYYHDIHCKIKRKQTVDDPNVYPDTCYWFMDEETVKNQFSESYAGIIDKAILNTARIADQCNVMIDNKIRMPSIDLNNGKSDTENLRDICYNEFNRVEAELSDPSRYMEQLIYELDTIDELGFSGYFLIVIDLINYARKNNIPVGPGRGSVCGSLVAYFSGIVETDPIKCGLLFERFLSKHRKGSVPDIDLDFDSSRRKEMFKYVNEKYGVDHCAFVSTLQMRKAKGAIRDAGRYLNVDLPIVNAIANIIPDSYYDDGEKADEITIEDCLNWLPEFARCKEKHPRLFDIAEHIEGIPTTTGIHAAGIIISPTPLTGSIPLIRPDDEEKSNYLCSSLNLHDSESFGCIKFDFLSLGSLSVYDNTEKMSGLKFDYRNDEYNDPNVWSLIGSSNTAGIFQISSYVYKKRMPRLIPKSLDQLAACLALVRGPCIISGMDEEYMQIIEGKRTVKKLHEFYDSATEKTNGVILYQEQIMQIIVNFSFYIEDSYRIMKTVAKKKVKELAAFEKDLRAAAAKQHVSNEIVDTIWGKIKDMGLYCFNASHAFGYALLVYKSAWLKTYASVEFSANNLSRVYLDKTKTKDKKIKEAYTDIKRLKINVLMPDINKSEWFNTVEDGNIRLGFCSIKSFGQIAFDDVLKERADKEFSSFEDFYSRVPKTKCNKAKILVAILAGAFDCFSEDKYSIIEIFKSLHKIKEDIKSVKIGKDTLKLSDKNISKKILNL